MISYLTGAIFFLILSLVLFTGRWARTQKTWLAFAAMTSFIWSATAAYQAAYDSSLFIPHFLEPFRDLAFLLFLLHILNVGDHTNNVRSRALILAQRTSYAIVPILLLSLTFQYYVASSSLAAILSNLTYAGFLFLSVIGLVLIEQLLRNSRPEMLRAIKYLCLGIGGIFIYDLYLYADALLLQQLDSSLWYARGFANAIIVPIIGITVVRNPQLSPDIFVSRRIVFHTAALLGAGIYLLAIGFGGYYVRYYGGEWGVVAQTIFFFGALLVLLVLMFSVPLRARLRVLINKHFFHYKYDYREEWLRFIRTLSFHDSDSQMYQRAVRALAQIISSPGGILWMCNDGGSYEPVARWNMTDPSPPAVSAESPLICFLKRREWVVNLDEYDRETESASIHGELIVPAWLRDMKNAWLVLPLIQDESLLGFIILARSSSHAGDFNWEDCDLLKTAGRQAASHLAQYEASRALAEARQFEAFNRLSAYVVHDLKNLIAQLSLVLSNASKHRNNPRFMEDTIHTVENSVAKMNHLLAHLKGGVARREHVALVMLDDLLAEVVRGHAANKPVPNLQCMTDGVTVKADRERLAAVMGHIIQNAQDATPDDGTITIRAMMNGKCVVVEVEDTGCGMDERFIKERLFRPFYTTKGNSGMGIGAYEAREFMHTLGGDIQVESQLQMGTTFRIRIPYCTDDGVELNYRSGTS